jgi:hypothetical protein
MVMLSHEVERDDRYGFTMCVMAWRSQATACAYG